MNNNLKKIIPIVLSAISSIGVLGTAILAAKNSKKFVATEDKKSNAKNFFKCFWPTILCGSATIGSITAGTLISKKTEASLSAAVIMLERGYSKYQGKVKQMLGVDTHTNIVKEIAKDDTKNMKLPSNDKDGRTLYYNNYIGHFYAKQEDVNRAILNMNMRLHSSPISQLIKWEEKGYCNFKQFVEDAKAELLDESIYNTYKDFGWSYEYLSDICEDEWIYDGFNNQMEDEPDVKVLVFMTADPIYLPDGWNHDEYLYKRSEKWHGRLIEDDPQSDENSDEKYYNGDLPPWATYEFD